MVDTGIAELWDGWMADVIGFAPVVRGQVAQAGKGGLIRGSVLTASTAQ